MIVTRNFEENQSSAAKKLCLFAPLSKTQCRYNGSIVVKEMEAVSSNMTTEPEVDKARQHSVQLAHYA